MCRLTRWGCAAFLHRDKKLALRHQKSCGVEPLQLPGGNGGGVKRAGAGEGARIAEKIEGAKTYTVSITILLRKSDFRRRGLPRSVSGVGVFQNLILEANAFTTPRFIMCFWQSHCQNLILGGNCVHNFAFHNMFLTLGMQKPYSAWYIASPTPVQHSPTSIQHPVQHPVQQTRELSIRLKASSKKTIWRMVVAL